MFGLCHESEQHRRFVSSDGSRPRTKQGHCGVCAWISLYRRLPVPRILPKSSRWEVRRALRLCSAPAARLAVSFSHHSVHYERDRMPCDEVIQKPVHPLATEALTFLARPVSESY